MDVLIYYLCLCKTEIVKPITMDSRGGSKRCFSEYLNRFINVCVSEYVCNCDRECAVECLNDFVGEYLSKRLISY